jgi:Spy/CpxP family protein refolding chaperone
MGDAMNEIEKTNTSRDYLKQMHRWRMAFFGLVILLAGFVIGAASIMIMAPHKLTGPLPPREIAIERLLAELQSYLHLTPEQHEKIEPILKEDMQKLDNIRADARSEIQNILGQMNKDIAAVLTEQQKQIWQQRINHLQRQLRPPGRGPGEGGQHRGGPQERMRMGPGPFGPRRDQGGPNRPWDDSYRRPIRKDGNTPNELP